MATTVSKKMGFWMCAALVVGNMVGSGIFLLPSSLAPFGGISVLGWLIASAGSVALALMFALLVRAIPKAGGPYAYTKAAYGDFAGYLCAWCYWKAAWIGNAAIAVTLVGYLRVFFPILGNPIYGFLAAAAAIWTFSGINLLGTRMAGWFAIWMTSLKLIPLLVIGTVGWWYFDIGNITYSAEVAQVANKGTGSWLGLVASAAALTMWSFIGLESATVPAEDVENPQKTIARATVLGTIVAAIVYITSVTVIQGMLPTETLMRSTAPFADAAQIIFGKTGYYLVAAGAVIACLGTLNGWILLQGQIPMAAARDGLFPSSLAKLNHNGVPAFAIFVSSVFVTILMIFDFQSDLVGMFRIIALLGTLAALVPYVLCAGALMQLWVDKKIPVASGGAKLIVWVSVISFVYGLWAIYGAGEEASFWTLLLLLAGLPLYTWRKYKNQKVTT